MQWVGVVICCRLVTVCITHALTLQQRTAEFDDKPVGHKQLQLETRLHEQQYSSS